MDPLSLPVTSLYAGLFTFLYVVLVFRVVRTRGADKVSIGNGQSKRLEYIIRVKGIERHLQIVSWVILGPCKLSRIRPLVSHHAGNG